VARAVDTGVNGVVMEIPSSQHMVDIAYRWPMEKAIETSIEATRFAKDNGLEVVFFPIDLIDDTPKGLVLAGIPDDARVIVSGQELVAEGDVVEPVEADAQTVRKLAGEAGAGTQ